MFPRLDYCFGEEVGEEVGEGSSKDLDEVIFGIGSNSSYSSSSEYSLSISLFSRIRCYILSSILSLRGFPNVYGKKKPNPQATPPKIAETNQELSEILDAMVPAKGETMLPTIPTKLTQPKPMLLI